MKYKTVTTFEMWVDIKAMGTYEMDFKNGELWSFNGGLWYLSHLELPAKELRDVIDFYS